MAGDYQLMRTQAQNRFNPLEWEGVIPAGESAFLADVVLFDNHLVYSQIDNAVSKMTIRDLTSGRETPLTFNDDIFVASFSGNYNSKSRNVRVFYSSMTTPATYYNFNLSTGKSRMLGQAQVSESFSSDNYKSERVMITARDGEKVPVSLVYNKNTFRKGTNPLFQFGYGAYGTTLEPYFSANRLSLLDRGIVYAVPHVRGSDILGYSWYRNGSALNKKNSFNDFIDVTKGLVDQQYCDGNKVFAAGMEAGGLLIGAVANQAPQLYLGMLAQNPAVDIVTTLLAAEEGAPWAGVEFDEWGNPNERTDYEYMMTYSPYDNVHKKNYPNIFVSTSFYGPIGYWEGAKWVARLRNLNAGDSLILLETDIGTEEEAERPFDYLRSLARQYTFLLDLL